MVIALWGSCKNCDRSYKDAEHNCYRCDYTKKRGKIISYKMYVTPRKCKIFVKRVNLSGL